MISRLVGYLKRSSPPLQLRKRQLPGVDPTVEARDMDDWMVVDCGNVIVNVMDAGALGGRVVLKVAPAASCHSASPCVLCRGARGVCAGELL